MADQFQYPKTSTPVFAPNLPAVPSVPAITAKGIFPERVDQTPQTMPGYTVTSSWLSLSIVPTMRAAHGRYADQVLDVDAMTPY